MLNTQHTSPNRHWFCPMCPIPGPVHSPMVTVRLLSSPDSSYLDHPNHHLLPPLPPLPPPCCYCPTTPCCPPLPPLPPTSLPAPSFSVDFRYATSRVPPTCGQELPPTPCSGATAQAQVACTYSHTCVRLMPLEVRIHTEQHKRATHAAAGPIHSRAAEHQS